MTKLDATYLAFHGLLRGELTLSAAAQTLGTDSKRLALYRDFVHDHVVGVVHKNFPICSRLLGESFDPLVEAFTLASPASSWELNQAAEAFPDFLEARLGEGHAALVPFHLALARFEWELFAVYVDPAEIETIPSNEAPRTDALSVNPTLRVLPSEYALVPWVLEYEAAIGSDSEAGTERPPPLPQRLEAPEFSLVFRHPQTDMSAYWRASDRLLFALKVVIEKIPIAEAAQATGSDRESCEALLRAAYDLGLLICPPTPPLHRGN